MVIKMPHDQVKDFLDPVLTEFGFKRGVVVSRKGDPSAVTRVHWEFATDPMGFGLIPTIDVYYADIYPNDKGEAFMHCFTATGHDTGADLLVVFMRERGIHARSTSHKKFRGIRFAFPLDYGY